MIPLLEEGQNKVCTQFESGLDSNKEGLLESSLREGTQFESGPDSYRGVFESSLSGKVPSLNLLWILV